MFYLTTHSTHFILQLYGVGHMVKDHSDNERGNPLPPHGLLFLINRNLFFVCFVCLFVLFVCFVFVFVWGFFVCFLYFKQYIS